MDVKNPTTEQSAAGKARQPLGEPQIRTMKGDLSSPGKGGKESLSQDWSNQEARKPSPPEKLPVVESIGGLGAPSAPSTDRKERRVDLVKPETKPEKTLGIKERIDEIRSKMEREKGSFPVRQPAPKPPVQKPEETKKIDSVAKEAEKTAEASRPEKKRRLKPILIGAFLVVVVVGVGGFFYLKNYQPGFFSRFFPKPVHSVCQDFQCVEIEGEGENECSTGEDCLPPEPTLPDTLISVGETKVVQIDKSEETLLPEKLAEVLGQEQEKGVLKRVLVKVADGVEKEYLDLDGLISSLGINIPSEVSQFVEEAVTNGGNYTLFLYGQPEGNRLGLIINLKDGAEITEIMTAWEETAKADLSPLLAGADIANLPAEEFKDNLYQGVNIRYVNFPEPDLSIDYAIIGNLLVIGSSRESMYAAVDNLIIAAAETSPTSTSTPAE